MQDSMHLAGVEITVATLDDLPSLAEINRLAFMRECTAQIVFPSWPDENNMRKLFIASLQDELLNPHTQIFKAVETTTGEMLGFIGLTLEQGQEDKSESEESKPDSLAESMKEMAPSLNMPFIMAMGAASTALKHHRAGTEHHYECTWGNFGDIRKYSCSIDLSPFAVPPTNQRKGIGSKLLQHCLDIADDSGLPIWLLSFPGSHGLYLRHGFSDVDHQDLDLNAWDDYRFRGYGIYRSYAMVRQPSVK
ncbi:hypothetical protein MMC10_001321 [Thelotrema lepadinum]|nr:hypothetical protein [Thelotrema lepadinum]